MSALLFQQIAFLLYVPSLAVILFLSVPLQAVAQVRLVDGSTDCSGRVEVYYNSQWGTVCDDDWDMSDAEVVCRQLGCGDALCAPTSAHFGLGSENIWMDDVNCTGAEGSLTECSHSGFGSHDCSHFEDASVVCTGENQPPNISLTLSQSMVLPGESIEIGCFISSDTCSTTVFHLYKDGAFVMNRSTSAYEKSVNFMLPYVDSSSQGNYSCGYSPNFTESTSIGISVGTAPVRLVGGSNGCSGRVEVYYNSQWGTVCDDDWDMSDAQVVCRQLGCGDALCAPTSAHFGLGSGNIWMDDVNCTGAEGSLTECSHSGFGSHDCYHGEVASVVCSGASQTPSISLISSYSSVLPGETIQIRCSTPSDTCSNTVFKLYRNGVSVMTMSPESHQKSVTFSLSLYSQGGSYTCALSPNFTESGPISISLVKLPKPVISLQPSRELIWGQSVQMTCSISTLYVGGTFTLLFGTFKETQRVRGSSATFTIPRVDFRHGGFYYCLYQTSVSHRDFYSSLSDFVHLSVVVMLPRPLLSLQSEREPSWHQAIQMTCSISTQHLGGTFILQQLTGPLEETDKTSSNASTFTIPQVDFGNEGSYYCQYQTQVSGQNFTSPRSESVSFSVVVTLPKPLLTLQTGEEAEPSLGQAVQMTCSISTQHLGGTFTLQQLSGSYREIKAASGTSAVFTIRQVDFVHEGSYYCQYRTRVSSRDFTSSHSDSVSFSVVVTLPKPVLRLQTEINSSWGQPVQMTCSISTQYLGGTFTLQQLSGSYRETKAASGTSAVFTIRQVDFAQEGPYYCQYQARVSGRDFTSSHSDSVSFSVVVSLSQPIISIRTPEGELVLGPHSFEVPRGQNFSIICSTKPQYQGGSFHLISDESAGILTELAVNYSASFYFPEADFFHAGHYSCSYEVTLSTRLFTSERTDELHVTIRALTWMEWSRHIAATHPSVFYGATLGLLLLFMVLCSALLMLNQNKAKYVVKEEYWPMSTFKVPESEQRASEDSTDTNSVG